MDVKNLISNFNRDLKAEKQRIDLKRNNPAQQVQEKVSHRFSNEIAGIVTGFENFLEKLKKETVHQRFVIFSFEKEVRDKQDHYLSNIISVHLVDRKTREFKRIDVGISCDSDYRKLCYMTDDSGRYKADDVIDNANGATVASEKFLEVYKAILLNKYSKTLSIV